jgi:hypothetical protein
MNTFLKANKNLKSRKATVILLSLFLIFFISSIIGIIYSYNKRIFQLAKQERDNYKVFKKQFDEMFANLYMVDLIPQGWQIGGIQNLDLIKIYSRKDSSYTYTYNGNSSNPTIGLSGNIDINNDIFNLSSSGDANPPINTSFTLPTAELKGERNDTADRLKDTNAVKNEIERKLKELLGNNIEILEFNQDTNNNKEIDNKIKNGKTGKLKYTVIIQKNIKIPQSKKEKEIKQKYKIDLEYEASIAGNVEVIFPESIEYTSPITKTIYNEDTGKDEEIITGYKYDNVSISMYITATLNSSSNLTKFEIKKIK